MISILLAVYNGELYLKKSIESILNQSYTDFELLIGFNGTVDESKKIVSNFNDARIRVFDYGMDSGKSKTLNKLIKEAKGEWLAIQDDDDIWLSNKLVLQFELASKGNYDVIGSKIFYCDEKEVIIGSPIIASNHNQICLLSRKGYNQIPNTTAIFKKNLVFEVKGWNENIVGVEDFDFWLKLMKSGAKFKNIDEKLVLHRLHTKSNFNTQRYNVNSIVKKYYSPNISSFLADRIIVSIYLIRSKFNLIFWKIKLMFTKNNFDEKESCS